MSKLAPDKRSQWDRRLLALAILSIVIGVVTMLVSPLAAVELQVGILGAGAGIVSIGVGVLAVQISKKSDDKMKSIANLEFDEKGAMIEEYETYFSQNFDKTKFERFRWDLEAITHVARWADKDKRTRISRSVDIIAASINGKVTKDSLDRIRSLSSKIKGKVT